MRRGFAPSEAAQVDFGAGRVVPHLRTGAISTPNWCSTRPSLPARMPPSLRGAPQRIIIDSARSAAPATSTRRCSAPTPSAQRAMALRTTPVRRATRRSPAPTSSAMATCSSSARCTRLRSARSDFAVAQGRRQPGQPVPVAPTRRHPPAGAALHAGARMTQTDHLPPDALAWSLVVPQQCLAASERIGPRWRQLIEAIFANRAFDKLRAAQGILRLATVDGDTRVEGSARHRVRGGYRGTESSRACARQVAVLRSKLRHPHRQHCACVMGYSSTAGSLSVLSLFLEN